MAFPGTGVKRHEQENMDAAFLAQRLHVQTSSLLMGQAE